MATPAETHSLDVVRDDTGNDCCDGAGHGAGHHCCGGHGQHRSHGDDDVCRHHTAQE